MQKIAARQAVAKMGRPQGVNSDHGELPSPISTSNQVAAMAEAWSLRQFRPRSSRNYSGRVGHGRASLRWAIARRLIHESHSLFRWIPKKRPKAHLRFGLLVPPYKPMN